VVGGSKGLGCRGRSHLRGLKNLKVLKLSRCQISDEAVADLRLALPNCEFKLFTDEPADAR